MLDYSSTFFFHRLNRDRSRGLTVDEQKKQTIFDAPKVIAIGIASPAATLLTSRFGIAGTLLGLALGAMILTAVADFLKVYLARSSHAAATIMPGAIKAPRGFPTSLFRRKGGARPKAPYRGFSSPPGGRWRRWSLLVGRSVVAAGISFLLGLGGRLGARGRGGVAAGRRVGRARPLSRRGCRGRGAGRGARPLAQPFAHR